MTPLPCPRCLMWDGRTCDHPAPTARTRDADGRPAEPGDDSASVEGWLSMMTGLTHYDPTHGAATPCPGFIPSVTP